MYALSQEVLRTDVSGMPLEWIDYRDAVRLHFMGQVAYSFGQVLFELRGGTNARTGRRTVFQVSSIIATAGHTHNPGHLRHGYVPPLNNETLFRRDDRVHLEHGALAGAGIGAATQPEQGLPERVRHLPHEMQPDRVPVVDPLQWHPRDVRA